MFEYSLLIFAPGLSRSRAYLFQLCAQLLAHFATPPDKSTRWTSPKTLLWGSPFVQKISRDAEGAAETIQFLDRSGLRASLPPSRESSAKTVLELRDEERY